MANNKELKVTSMSTLKGYTKGTIVRLPDFGPGQEFYARVRRPSILAMLKDGDIPNTLLESASDLFAEGSSSFVTNRDKTGELFEVIDKLCEATFVEPSYNDLKEAGIQLTDEQMMFIFNYTQNGAEVLESFRKEREDNELDSNEPGVQGET